MPPYGTPPPYAAMYPHGGIYGHPPMTPVSVAKLGSVFAMFFLGFSFGNIFR